MQIPEKTTNSVSDGEMREDKKISVGNINRNKMYMYYYVY